MIKQDTIVHRPQRKSQRSAGETVDSEQADASHYFCDEFQPLLNTEGPVKYVRRMSAILKRAKKPRRGDYSPELFLNLHGLTQLQAGTGRVDCRLPP